MKNIAKYVLSALAIASVFVMIPTPAKASGSSNTQIGCAMTDCNIGAGGCLLYNTQGPSANTTQTAVVCGPFTGKILVCGIGVTTSSKAHKVAVEEVNPETATCGQCQSTTSTVTTTVTTTVQSSTMP